MVIKPKNNAHTPQHENVTSCKIDMAPTDLNRAAWNAVTKTHRDADFDRLVATLKQPKETCLSAMEIKFLTEKIGISDKTIAQIGCNNGRELMSLKKLGAKTCIGFDIADAVIDYANDLSAATHIECQFVRADIYAIDPKYHGLFDLVYISVGVFGWFPDINGAFVEMTKLLKPGGHIFIYEMHPMLDMYKPDNECSTEEMITIINADSYFRSDPFISEGGINYVTQDAYAAQPEAWYHHKMSDIIQAGIDQDLKLILFRELEENISLSYRRFNKIKNKPPMSYVLIFSRIS